MYCIKLETNVDNDLYLITVLHTFPFRPSPPAPPRHSSFLIE